MLVTMLKKTKKKQNKKPLWKMLKIWIIESDMLNISLVVKITAQPFIQHLWMVTFSEDISILLAKWKIVFALIVMGFVCVCDFLLVSLFNNKYCVTENSKQHERAKSRKDVLPTNIKVFLWSFGDTDIKIKPYTCVYLMFSVITRCSGIIIEYYGSLLGSLRNITVIVGL